MRNLLGKGLNVGTVHHGCEYCGDTDKYWCHSLQYLHLDEEIDLDIKKDR
jgi:hypothetical protein